MKSATKPIWHYPPHLRHVATLTWEIKNSNFWQMWKKKQTNCILIASNFVTLQQILIFSVFKIASLSPYWLQIKFSMSLFFLQIYFCDQSVAPKIRHSRHHCSVCQQPTWYSATRTRFWFKKFVFEGVHSKQVDRQISWEKLDKA